MYTLSNILIVEDNADLLSVLVSLLELSGHSVVAASNYEEAVAAIERNKPHLASP